MLNLKQLVNPGNSEEAGISIEQQSDITAQFGSGLQTTLMNS